MRLGLVVCVFGRPELTSIVLDHAERGSPKNTDACAVVSSDADDAVVRRAVNVGHEWFIVRAPNDPRGAKWNAGMSALRDGGCDAVMILGTDDLISDDVFRAALAAIDGGADWFGLTDAYVYSVAAQEMRYWPGYPAGDPRHGETIGTCRTYSRRHLDAHDWKLWPDDARTGLDSFANPARSKFAANGVTASVLSVGPMVDVKAYPGVDLGSFYSFAGSRPVDADVVWSAFPRDTVGRILDLREKLNRRTPSDPPLVSGCIIARDCETTIGRAIYSMRGIVDETVVVVDDRTTDRTREVAEESGARVLVRTFDDFAGQRNASIEAARGAWCLILDADEWIENPGNIRAAVENAPADVDAIGVSFAYADGSPSFIEVASFQERVIRRANVRYRFPVHHKLTGARETMTCDGLVMEKYDAAQVERSARRAIPILEELATSRPNEEMHIHALHYLARSYAMIGEWGKAIERATLCANRDPWDAANWLTLIGATERRDGLLACGPVIHDAMRAHPQMRELRWWAARWHVAVLGQLTAQPDAYSMVPTRASRYMPHLEAALPFFMLHRETAKPT